MPKVERVQVGIRLEKQMIKVLKALAEYMDMSLNDLVENMLQHELEGNSGNYLEKKHLKIVANLKKLYEQDDNLPTQSNWSDEESEANTRVISGAQ